MRGGNPHLARQEQARVRAMASVLSSALNASGLGTGEMMGREQSGRDATYDRCGGRKWHPFVCHITPSSPLKVTDTDI